MGALAREGYEELRIDFEAPVWAGIDDSNPAADTLGIELRIPRPVQRIAQVNPASVPAQLQHLRTAVQCTGFEMRSMRDNAAQAHLACQLRPERVAYIPLLEIAGAEACDIEKAVVQTEIDISDKRRHRLERLQRGR